jgi:hypothetical protein
MTDLAAAPAADSASDSAIRVEPVRGAQALRQFIRVPGQVYRGHGGYVAPLELERLDALRQDKNPFYQHGRGEYWLAYRSGQPVGRISAQIDTLAQERHGADLGHFGNIDGEDDPAIFRALLDTAANWLKAQGMRRMLGPFSLSINEEIGVLVDGFDSPPVMFMPYHPPYVGRHLSALGFAKAKDVVAYDLHVPSQPPPVLRHFASRLGQAERIRIRPVDMKRYGDELNTLIDIFNDAWSENWHFIPFTKAEAAHLSKGLRPLINANLFWVAELDGKPICMALCLQNLCEAVAGFDGKILPFNWAKLLWRLKVAGVKTARVPLMGMRRRYHGTAIGAVVLYSVFDALRGGLRRCGIDRVELSWVLEDNMALRGVLESLGARVYKTYRMYEKEIP